MKQIIVTVTTAVGILLAALLFQTAVLPALGLNIVPCLVICAVVALAYQTSPYLGIGAGLVLGLVMDALFSLGIGNYSLVLVSAGFVAGMAGGRFKPEILAVPAVLAVAAHLGFDLFSLLLIYFTRSPMALTWGMVGRGLASLLLTGACTVPIHLLFYRVMNRRRRRDDDFSMLFAG